MERNLLNRNLNQVINNQAEIKKMINNMIQVYKRDNKR